LYLFFCVAEQFPDSRHSKFGPNLTSGRLEINDFGADINSRDR